MFSSSSSLNPFQYTTASQSMIAGSSNYTHNPSSFQQDHSSPFPHFTAPFLDDDDLLLNEFLSQQHQRQEQLEGQLLRSNATPLANGVEGIDLEAADEAKTTKKKKDRSVKAEKQPVPRRRTGKKDRHSKIYTAQGPRDRRMRLSLHIARKFFDLQDMLGFDKASKTIEWLFSKSKAAIKDLTDNLPGVNKSRSTAAGGKSASSTSESEVVSVTKLTPDGGGGGGGGGGDHNRGMVLVAAEDESFASIPGEKRNKRSHKNKPPPSMNPVAKDSRNKARARARERTKEKLKIKDLDKLKQRCPYQSNPNHLEQLGSSSVSLGNGENRGSGTGSQDMCSTIKAVMLQEESNTYLQPQNQMTSVGIAGKPFKAAAAPRSSSIFDFSGNYEILGGPNIENDLSGIPATWDLNNIAKIQYRYFAMPSVRLPTGNSHVQSPNAIFIPIPQNAQEPKTSSASYMSSSTIPEENLASIFMTTSITQQINPSQVLMDISNPTDQPNPSSILMSSTESSLHSHFMGHQLSSNSNLSKYGGSY